MLADIYLGTALAIFLAIFGWSENIFGLSQKTREKEAEFMKRSGLTLRNYLELRRLVLPDQGLDQGEYTKKLVNVLKNSKIKSGDKQIFNKLKENERHLKKLGQYTTSKKFIILVLFLYLFITGTIMLLMENFTGKIGLLNPTIIWFQGLLFLLIAIGGFIYLKISKYERKIQLNLNTLILEINGGE